jgi:hypothetical protein
MNSRSLHGENMNMGGIASSICNFSLYKDATGFKAHPNFNIKKTIG